MILFTFSYEQNLKFIGKTQFPFLLIVCLILASLLGWFCRYKIDIHAFSYKIIVVLLATKLIKINDK